MAVIAVGIAYGASRSADLEGLETNLRRARNLEHSVAIVMEALADRGSSKRQTNHLVTKEQR